MRRLGSVLIMLVGVLVASGQFSGAGGGSSAAGFALPTPCGGIVVDVGSQVIDPSCVRADLTVTKTVIGTGAAPAGGWELTVTSTNCGGSLFFTVPVMPVIVPAAGGVVVIPGLTVYTDLTNTVLCNYSVAEAAVTGWTPQFSPAGSFTLNPAGSALGLSNTGSTTTTAAPTTTVAPTTTAPATTTPTPTTTGPAPAVPTTTINRGALPATGTSTSTTELVIGFGLIALGAATLFAGRRQQPAAN